MGSRVDDRSLVRLMTWLSPGFPVGSYAYSHGIETAVDAGLVVDRPTLKHWVASIIRHGSGALDAAILRAGHRAMAAGDWARLMMVAEVAEAMRGTAETALESGAQGQAFLATVRAAWPDPRLDRLAERLDAAGRVPAHAFAVGVIAAVAEIEVGNVAAAYLHAVAANLVSAGVRLIPLGQTDGALALAALETAVTSTVAASATADLTRTGTATWMVDWTSARHETQHVRLFRS